MCAGKYSAYKELKYSKLLYENLGLNINIGGPLVRGILRCIIYFFPTVIQT